jgi:serine/threonine protein kinase/predicted ATPase
VAGGAGQCLAGNTVLDLVQGRVDVAAADGILAHLDSCEACRSVVANAARSHGGAEATAAPFRAAASTHDYTASVDSLPPTLRFQLGHELASRFRLEALLGVGGMGVVWRATDLKLGRQVALKAMRTLTAENLLRFKTEFRALQDLQHPNLAQLDQLFEVRGDWFFTMELVRGVDFLRWVRADEAVDSVSVRSDVEAAPTLKVAGASALALARAATSWSFDEARLRSALSQLCVGTAVVHAAGKIHRDIKPSNIMVTDEGRVVLMDFGLVVDAAPSQLSLPSGIAGTVAYMAPEQASGESLTPAADWYAIGVVLYEALTGRAPFSGTHIQMMLDKTRMDPPPPAAIARGVPDDLNELCVALLRRDPKARPRASEVLERLGATVGGARELALAKSPAASDAPPFVGRQRELELLRAAFADSRQRAVAVFLRGESGIGKTSLVRHFVEQLEVAEPSVVALRGRCYERESVPYKGMDDIVDALSRRLARMNQVEAALLLSPDVAALVRLFPTLLRSEAVSRLPELRAPDPQEMRSRAFAGLRHLVSELARRQRVVLTLDDLQWSDADSLAVLGDLLRRPDAPPLLLLATVQTDAPAAFEAILNTLEEKMGDVRRIELGALAEPDARALARLLVAQGADADPLVNCIAAEATGHPLFIQELAHGNRVKGAAAGADLNQALRSRVQSLPEQARQLVELLAVAGRPLTLDAASLALQLDVPLLVQSIALVKSARLAKGVAAPNQECVDVYHNRVRHAVVSNLPSDVQRRLHARLARGLEATGDDSLAIALVEHLEAAGEAQRAAERAEVTAARATRALAFQRAAALYDAALRLGQFDAVQTRRLRVLRGEALANAGRGGEAAEVYLTAAEDAPSAERLELQRRAADQLVRSGRFDRGFALYRNLLSAIDLRLPETSRAALWSLAMARAKLRLRGLAFRERQPSEIEECELRRIDICWAASAGVASAAMLQGAGLATTHLHLALDAGDPQRISIGIATEALMRASAGPKGRSSAHKLLGQAGTLAEKCQQPYARALISLCSSMVACFSGEWSKMDAHAERGQRLFREHCSGTAWELDQLQLYRCIALFHLGRIGDLGQLVAQAIRDADERGDIGLASTMRTGHANFVSLAADDVGRARADIGYVQKIAPRAALVAQTLCRFSARYADLYEGDCDRTLAGLKEDWPWLRKTLMLRVQYYRSMMSSLRSSALVAKAARLELGERRELLTLAARDARGLARQNMPWTRALASLVDGGVAAGLAKREEALSAYARAATELERAEMPLYAQVARLRHGELLGGAEGRKRVDEARAWMLGQAILKPERFAAMFAPSVAIH